MRLPLLPRSARPVFGWLLLALLPAFLGCRSDRVVVNPADLHSPQYAYRLDELARLQMAADGIFELERKKQYGRLYDEYGGPTFKNSISRRRFLIMSNCVETHLGGMEGFDPNDLGFRRMFVRQGKTRQPLDILTRRIHRVQGGVDEQLVLVAVGLDYRLNGLYWISRDKNFLQCIRESPKIEQMTTPKPAGEEAETEAGKTTPPPVREMQAAEIRRESVGVRPAGAGAVRDARPLPPSATRKKRPSPDKEKDNAPAPQPPEPTTPPVPSGPPIPGDEQKQPDKSPPQ